jgi:hypothetical protein
MAASFTSTAAVTTLMILASTGILYFVRLHDLIMPTKFFLWGPFCLGWSLAMAFTKRADIGAGVILLFLAVSAIGTFLGAVFGIAAVCWIRPECV